MTRCMHWTTHALAIHRIFLIEAMFIEIYSSVVRASLDWVRKATSERS